jgi:hypothetical protein
LEPNHKQDAFLELVRGFEALGVPADWRQQLKVEEDLAEKEEGGGGGSGWRRWW